MPAKILSVEGIPYTLSGKKVEMAVTKMIHGEAVDNKDALTNPQVLRYYKDRKELKK